MGWDIPLPGVRAGVELIACARPAQRGGPAAHPGSAGTALPLRRGAYSQPRSRAVWAASKRLAVSVFWIAEER